ncbi:hypothetical protein NL676_025298 [Syzygium grande]|nr:hypothetical protein NL676_025298 [Syzygium grande]
MESVPSDGKTWGEVMFRGNTVMSGYFKDTKASEIACEGGWFRNGDLGVKHPDGGRVGEPDDRWGAVPCAFVKLKDGFSVMEEEIIKYCRHKLPRLVAPMTVAFANLPKTSTGKTQKFVLKEKAKAKGCLSG